jgi:hypothetical protein
MNTRNTSRFLAVCSIAIAFQCIAATHAAGYKAAVASAVTTPTDPIWLGGYGSRTQPADGKVHDLHAKILALQDAAGYTVVLITLDTENVPRAFADDIATTLQAKHGLSREQIVVSCSHTHSGPGLASPDARIIYPMTPEQYAGTVRYTNWLRDRAVALTGEAISRLAPAELTRGNGSCGFGVNRRNNKEAATTQPGFVPVGPVDRDVPVLCVKSNGKLQAVLFGYACHCTTLNGQQWCGDWAGFAKNEIEAKHPGTTAMFMTGCGADTNPLPRRSLDLCQKYGKALATSVESVIDQPMRTIDGPLHAAFRHVELGFDRILSREELETAARSGKSQYEKRWARVLLDQLADSGKLPQTYPYPVQAIGFGNDLLMVVLGGEVVVDYSLRLKRELGPDRTWVFAYANDVCAYMPSERVLKEGGYEGGEAMVYYGLPSPWAAGLEDKIVAAVKDLAQKVSVRPAQ